MASLNSGPELHVDEIALAILPAASTPAQCHETVNSAAQESNTPLSPELEAHYLVHGKVQLAATLLSLFLCLFLAALDFTIATTALPTITSAFHSSAGYTWIGSSYLLANAASTPIWGKLSDIFGRKPMLLSAIAAFAAGSAVCASATNITVFLVGRSIQGMGAGGLICLVNVCISDMFSLRDRGFYLGLTGVVWGIASGVGPLLGGAFTQYVSWRWNWWINLPCSGVSFFVLCFCLHGKRSELSLWNGLMAIDWLGILAILGLSLMTLLGLNFGGILAPWKSPEVICLIVFGVFVGIIFLLYETKMAKNPLIPMRILQRISNNASLLVCFTHGFVNVSSWYFLPLYFQSSRLSTPFHSGLLLVPITVIQALTGVAAGWIIRRTGHYLYLIYTGLFLSTLGFSMFIMLSPMTPLSVVIIFELIAGLGIGMVFQPPLIALQSFVSNEDLAVATALFGFVRSFSTSVSVVIGGLVFQNVMEVQSKTLISQLGYAKAELFSGKNAAANVDVIGTLNEAQQMIVKKAFAKSLSRMWILYACVAAVGLVLSFGINRKVLEKHPEDDKNRRRNNA